MPLVAAFLLALSAPVLARAPEKPQPLPGIVHGTETDVLIMISEDRILTRQVSSLVVPDLDAAEDATSGPDDQGRPRPILKSPRMPGQPGERQAHRDERDRLELTHSRGRDPPRAPTEEVAT